MSITLEVEEKNKEFRIKSFEINELLGSGSYGSVFKVSEISTGNCFAIKRIEKTFENFILAKRTFREIKILSNLKHDNIIGLHRLIRLDEFENKNGVDNDVFLVMDLMETDLHRVIYSDQALTERHIKYFMYQLIKGLKYIHSAKIVHRDLKPSNILVNSNCNLKIGDFGMARSLSFLKDNLEQASNQDYILTQYVATRWYRAPELMYTRNYDEKIDIWSAGCIFSELVTRKPLFPSKNCMSSLKLIFSIVEFPGEEFCQSIKIPIIQKLLMETAKNYKQKDKIAQIHKETINDYGIDLLKNMLAIDFKKRYDAVKTIEHEFLSEFRNEKDENTINEQFLDFSFEIDLSISKMKDADSLNLIKCQIFNNFYGDKQSEVNMENLKDKFILEVDQEDKSQGYFRPESENENDNFITKFELEDNLKNSNIKDLLKKKLESKGIKKQDDIPIQKRQKTKETIKKNLKNDLLKDLIMIESNNKPKNKIRPILPKANHVAPNQIIFIAQPIYLINQPPVVISNLNHNLDPVNNLNENFILSNSKNQSVQILTDNIQDNFKNLSVEDMPKNNQIKSGNLTIITPKGTADGYSIGVNQDWLMSEVMGDFDFFELNDNHNDIFPSLGDIDILNEVIDKDCN